LNDGRERMHVRYCIASSGPTQGLWRKPVLPPIEYSYGIQQKLPFVSNAFVATAHALYDVTYL